MKKISLKNHLRVTLVCPGFSRQTIRLQPWRRVYEISRRLFREKVDVTVLSDTADEDSDSIRPISVVKIDNLQSSLMFGRNTLKNAILSTNPDIVVLYGTPFSAFYLHTFKSLGKPLIWDVETDIYGLKALSKIPARDFLNPINNLYTYLLTALFSRFRLAKVANSSYVQKIVVPNLHLKHKLVKKGINARKLEIISSTIDKEEISPLDRASKEKLKSKLGLAPTDFIVSYFGSPHVLRGPDVAINSMPKILENNKETKLLIFSRRNLNQATAQEKYLKKAEGRLVKAIEKSKLQENVHIIPGFLPRDQLLQYAQVTDIFVFPFRIVPSEPPISIFEFMQFGKPIVVTDIGCLREIVPVERGMTVKVANKKSLANAIITLRENPQQSMELGMRAKVFASTLPDWDSIAKQFALLVYSLHTFQRKG